RFAEKVVAVLDRGSFVSTYKHAVLLALMDLCLEESGRHGEPPTAVSTAQVARKVTELYWPQARPFSLAGEKARVLRQSSGRQARILSLVEEYRARAGLVPGTSLHRQRVADPNGVARLEREIEWTLVLMPLPKLQRIGRRVDAFLYEVGWDDGVRRGDFARASGFDNLVRFRPGAARHLVALAPVLRPMIHRQWSLLVTRLNEIPDSRVERFLFERDRAAVAGLGKPLLEIQRGRCFYCDGPVAEREVDHFVPWSRHPDDGIANLVVADPRCNRSKSDFLADLGHLERWSVRLHDHAGDLAAIAADQGWPRDERITTAVVRSMYAALPSDVLLWSAVDDFVPLEPARLRPVLAALPP
ncbi:MAG: HNH endonuclease, partial [Alphaproteobacteria bacterium]